ncbi:MAG: hypothetical protein CMJ93_08530 [Planctomycetes bacterium]|nr:hypothetical protein [Planctomycetota bacterium]|tara:strand:- start:7786 stop:8931 length:1146 start_codon:yes stop_codon:yes gene_type:complete
MSVDTGPLAGTRVVDFTWAAMGPYAGYLLASLGAEVIQVSRPAKGVTSTTASITQFFDVGKTCVKINVKEPRGKQILLDLTAQSDIFLENFRPGVIEGLGFNFEALQQKNPGLVMVSGSALGRGGDDSGYVGYAPIFSALSGLADSTGFSDGRPTEIRYPCDLTSGALMAFAAIAGLVQARRDRGAYVDLAARDALIWSLTSSFALPRQAITNRRGNDHERAFPHGLYRCKGEDQWLSIVVCSQVDLKSLCELLGLKTVSEQSPGDLSQEERRTIEQSLENWASQQRVDNAVRELQAFNIAAFASSDARDIWEDQHLRARGAFQYAQDVGWVAAPPWTLGQVHRSSPYTPSQDEARERVFQEILKMDTELIKTLKETDIIG